MYDYKEIAIYNKQGFVIGYECQTWQADSNNIYHLVAKNRILF